MTTSPYGPMVLVCNTRSGRGAVARALPEIRDHLRRRGLDFEERHTEYAGHATRITREALESGCRFVVAVGGDGTIHEVVNGMIVDDRAVRPDAVLGIVAAGTGSDFIKTFGLPEMPGHAVAHLDGGEAFPIDIGKVTYTENGNRATRYFPNIAEVGIGAETVAKAQSLPRWLGPTVYFFAFWMVIRGFKPANVKVDLVDRVHEGRMSNLVVANGQFFGGGMKVAPKAAPTDGLLDIQIHSARKREAIAIMPRMYKGEHIPHPDIHESKRVRLAIESEVPLRVEADGELLGHTPASFELLRDVIRLKV